MQITARPIIQNRLGRKTSQVTPSWAMSRIAKENCEIGWLRTNGLIHSGNPSSGTKPHESIPRISCGRVSACAVASGLRDRHPIASAPRHNNRLMISAVAQNSTACPGPAEKRKPMR